MKKCKRADLAESNSINIRNIKKYLENMDGGTNKVFLNQPSHEQEPETRGKKRISLFALNEEVMKEQKAKKRVISAFQRNVEI